MNAPLACSDARHVTFVPWSLEILVKLAFYDANTDTDTDILARILADTSDTRIWPVAS